MDDVWGPVGITKAVLPSMLQLQRGHIVLVTGGGEPQAALEVSEWVAVTLRTPGECHEQTR